jgi:hypothetical protein
MCTPLTIFSSLSLFSLPHFFSFLFLLPSWRLSSSRGRFDCLPTTPRAFLIVFEYPSFEDRKVTTRAVQFRVVSSDCFLRLLDQRRRACSTKTLMKSRVQQFMGNLYRSTSNAASADSIAKEVLNEDIRKRIVCGAQLRNED